MRHKITSFFGVLFVIGIMGIASGGGEEVSVSTESTDAEEVGAEESEPEEVTYSLDDAINLGDTEVTVINFEERDEVGDEFFNNTASEGGTLVAIQYTIKNISDEPIGSFSTPTAKLVDENGTEYSYDIDSTGNYSVETGDNDSKVLSDLNPGISVTDVKVFEVSKEKFSEGDWFIEIGGERVALK